MYSTIDHMICSPEIEVEECTLSTTGNLWSTTTILQLYEKELTKSVHYSGI